MFSRRNLRRAVVIVATVGAVVAATLAVTGNASADGRGPNSVAVVR
jgi:hypothetical protein